MGVGYMKERILSLVNRKLSLLLLILVFSLPIAKADGCGIVCPASTDKLSFFMRLLCNFGTWTFCHALSFVIIIIIFVGGYLYWISRKEETKRNVKIVGYVLLTIFLVSVFYPSIKALFFGNPFTSTTTTTTTIEDCDYRCNEFGFPPTKGTCRATPSECFANQETDLTDYITNPCTGGTPRCCCLLPCNDPSYYWWCMFSCEFGDCGYPYSQYKPVTTNFTFMPRINYTPMTSEYFGTNSWCDQNENRYITVNLTMTPLADFNMSVICDEPTGTWDESDIDCNPNLGIGQPEYCDCGGLPTGVSTIIKIQNITSTSTDYYNLTVRCWK
jgi:hypothetical protein